MHRKGREQRHKWHYTYMQIGNYLYLRADCATGNDILRNEGYESIHPAVRGQAGRMPGATYSEADIASDFWQLTVYLERN